MSTAATLPPIEAFRAGRHTDMHGNVVEITRAELQASANAYDPALFAAPIVIGHPTTEAPAFGWLGKLTVDERNTLIADKHTDVNPEFASLVHAKSYPKTSISFFRPGAKDNPVPGVWYPRHLGFLGAAQPALNLKPVVAFSADQSGYVSFMDYDDMTVAGLFRSLKNFLLAKFSTDPTGVENALQEYQLQQLVIGAATEPDDDASLAPAYSASGGSSTTLNEPKAGDPMSEELKAAQAAAAASEAKATEAVAKLAAAEASQRAVHFAAEADSLIKDGKLHPDERDNYVAFMARPDDAQTVEFAAADGTAQKFNAREWMQKFIARRAPLVEMKEIGKGKANTGAAAASFSAPRDVPVSSERLDLHNRAAEYAATHKVDYVTAVKAVQA